MASASCMPTRVKLSDLLPILSLNTRAEYHGSGRSAGGPHKQPVKRRCNFYLSPVAFKFLQEHANTTGKSASVAVEEIIRLYAENKLPRCPTCGQCIGGLR